MKCIVWIKAILDSLLSFPPFQLHTPKPKQSDRTDSRCETGSDSGQTGADMFRAEEVSVKA